MARPVLRTAVGAVALLACLLEMPACREAKSRSGRVDAAPSGMQPEGGAAPANRAEVTAVLHCHALAPDESLAVWLAGTVGPDGSWSLERLQIEESSGRVVITPVVRHTPVDAAIQMLIPLDRVLWLQLAQGVHVIEVRGRDTTFVDSVRVEPGVEREPPDTRLATSGPAPEGRALLVVEGMAGDGFTAAIEVREPRPAGSGEWRQLQGAERRGRALVGHLQVAFPPGSGELRCEARAVDGQGVADPTPAAIALPRRP